MNKFNFLLVLVLVLLGSIGNNAFNLDEEIEVYYVEAPLLKAMFGDLLENFKAFHSGVYFYTKDTKESYTLDYIAAPSILGAVFPSVNETADTINWVSNGTVQYIEGFNQSYWSSGQQFIMLINGEIFQQYLCWIGYYNETYPFYNLFEVRNNDTLELYLSSSICNDFAWATFQTLYDLGGELNEASTTPPSRDFITLYVNEQPYPIEDPQDPQNWAQLMNFYEKMQLQPNETALQFVTSLINAFSGNFFYYRSQVYYNLSLVAREPLTYTPAALPSGDRNPSSVQYAAGCQLPNTNPKHDRGLGGGWIFTIILFSCATVYIVGGLVYNVQVRGETLSPNALPNYDRWAGLFGYVRDGCRFIYSKVRGSSTKDATTPYVQINDETNQTYFQ